MHRENMPYWWNWSNGPYTLRLSFGGLLCQGLKDHLMAYESTLFLPYPNLLLLAPIMLEIAVKNTI